MYVLRVDEVRHLRPRVWCNQVINLYHSRKVADTLSVISLAFAWCLHTNVAETSALVYRRHMRVLSTLHGV